MSEFFAFVRIFDATWSRIGLAALLIYAKMYVHERRALTTTPNASIEQRFGDRSASSYVRRIHLDQVESPAGHKFSFSLSLCLFLFLSLRFFLLLLLADPPSCWKAVLHAWLVPCMREVTTLVLDDRSLTFFHRQSPSSGNG